MQKKYNFILKTGLLQELMLSLQIKNIYNMKKLRILFTITLILLISVSSLFAVPAKQQAITVKQSNGKLLTLLLQGDERVHWARTLDGYSLLKNENGDYVLIHSYFRSHMCFRVDNFTFLLKGRLSVFHSCGSIDETI